MIRISCATKKRLIITTADIPSTKSGICAYNAFDLLEQVDIDELKQSEVLLPEKRNQLVRILENLKEDDNPVIMVATLKH